MDETHKGWANRCLPLIVANEAGWVLLNPYAFEATWNGEAGTAGLTITFDDDDVPLPRPESRFGYGIITWLVPYLFRTTPGYNLLARGPANWPKDGVCALEGLVETDWAVATFTMNWKMTRANHPVRFEADEPFCMLIPQRRGELESFRPIMRSLESDPALHAAYVSWEENRHQASVRKFLSAYSREYEGAKLDWEQHYWKGTTSDGTPAPEHQIRLNLAEFEEG